jgi:hypothetical protein
MFTLAPIAATAGETPLMPGVIVNVELLLASPATVTTKGFAPTLTP